MQIDENTLKQIKNEIKDTEIFILPDEIQDEFFKKYFNENKSRFQRELDMRRRACKNMVSSNFESARKK